MMKRDSFKTQAPMLDTHPRKISRWAHFFVSFFVVGKFVDFMFCRELYDGALSFCCCLLLWEFWTLYDLGENHCVIMLIFVFLGHFWIVELFGIVKFNVDGLWSFALYIAFGIVGWILTWFFFFVFCVGMKLWEFDV